MYGITEFVIGKVTQSQSLVVKTGIFANNFTAFRSRKQFAEGTSITGLLQSDAHGKPQVYFLTTELDLPYINDPVSSILTGRAASFSHFKQQYDIGYPACIYFPERGVTETVKKEEIPTQSLDDYEDILRKYSGTRYSPLIVGYSKEKPTFHGLFTIDLE